MKRLFPLLLLTALAVSLWFNWRGPGIAPPPAASGPVPAASTAVLPGKVEEMDFSGTGLADEAWQLEPAQPGIPIPQAVPLPDTDGTLPLLPPPPADEEAGAAIRLVPGPDK